MAKRLLDEDLRQANKSTSPLKTQAFKLSNGVRYKSTAADGVAGKFAANNPAQPSDFTGMQTGAGTNLPTRGGRRFTGEANQNPAPSGFQQVLDIYTNPNTYTSPFTQPQSTSGGRRPKGGNVNPMLAPLQGGFFGVQTGAGAVGAPNNVNLGLYNNSPYNGFQTPTTNGFAARNNGFQTPTTNGFIVRNTASQNTPGPLQTTNEFINKQEQVNSTTTNTAVPNLGQPPRPEGTFNPNNKETAAQWKAYWNWEAANPQAAAAIALAEGRLSSAPVVMTREQIWQMKAAQRRKNAGNNSSPSYVSPVSSPTPYTGTGEYYSTILNTGSG